MPLNYRESLQFREALLQSKQTVIVLDANVDLDALASSLALSSLLAGFGTTNLIVCANQIPSAYAHIGGAEQIHISAAFAELGVTPDLIIVPDLGSLSQLEELYTNNREYFSAAALIHIDHHIESDIHPSLGIVDKTAAATCEVVALILQDLEAPIDRNIGTLLLAGIISDTRAYSTPNVTPKTLETASWLVKIGADVVAASRLARSLSLPQLKLWGLSLVELETVCGGQVGLATITKRMLERTGSEATGTSGLVNLIDDASEFVASVLLKELPDGQIRVSLRSSRKIAVLEIAAKFGGGGHTYAAACTMKDIGLEDAKAAITKEVCKLLENTTANQSR